MSVHQTSRSRIAQETYKDDRISSQEEAVIQRRLEQLKLEMGTTMRATYTVRFCVLDSHSMAPTPGTIEVWKHGGREHVGSEVEQKLYFCPGKILKKSDCEAIMPDVGNSSLRHVCTRCGGTWKGHEVIGELGGRLTRQNWAIALRNVVERLNREVELEGVVFAKGIREANLAEQLRDRGGEVLRSQIEKRKTVRYRFPNLMRDLNAGADLGQRMLAFLNSCSSHGALPRQLHPALPSQGGDRAPGAGA